MRTVIFQIKILHKGGFVGCLFTSENLKAGEIRDFEQSADSLNPNMDLSGSTIDAFAYRSISEQN